MWSDIGRAAERFSASPPIHLIGDVQVPEMWLYLFASDIAQSVTRTHRPMISSCTCRYACIRCVYVLTAECTALTVTLVVTLRKFISLVLSIWLFDNPFTEWHMVGAALVFLGTLLFAELNKQPARSAVTADKKTK